MIVLVGGGISIGLTFFLEFDAVCLPVFLAGAFAISRFGGAVRALRAVAALGFEEVVFFTGAVVFGFGERNTPELLPKSWPDMPSVSKKVISVNTKPCFLTTLN